ncbi:MAG: DNA adenine methylase [Clostridia bacterium]|nr:DNA adenine methylase [Clostridia bacterium]
MPKKKYFSPLRYPGGKSKISKYVQNLITANNLNDSTYIEPFAGGASVALYLLINSYVSKIIINDFDKSIYAFWYSVLNHTDTLCEKIKNTPIDIEQWYLQKDIQNNKKSQDILELGFSTFFLNRTNRSGIIKAGVIGGLNQSGNYKMDCRFNKDELIDRIRLIAEYKEFIELYNLDTIELIHYVMPEITERSFIFFDPPYYNKGSQLYVNFYKHDDHYELSQSISSINNHCWIVTYDYDSRIEKMYRQFRNKTYCLKYTAEKKYTGHEYMFFSDNLKIPEALESVII